MCPTPFSAEYRPSVRSCGRQSGASWFSGWSCGYLGCAALTLLIPPEHLRHCPGQLACPVGLLPTATQERIPMPLRPPGPLIQLLVAATPAGLLTVALATVPAAAAGPDLTPALWLMERDPMIRPCRSPQRSPLCQPHHPLGHQPRHFRLATPTPCIHPHLNLLDAPPGHLHRFCCSTALSILVPAATRVTFTAWPWSKPCRRARHALGLPGYAGIRYTAPAWLCGLPVNTTTQLVCAPLSLAALRVSAWSPEAPWYISTVYLAIPCVPAHPDWPACVRPTRSPSASFLLPWQADRPTLRAQSQSQHARQTSPSASRTHPSGRPASPNCTQHLGHRVGFTHTHVIVFILSCSTRRCSGAYPSTCLVTDTWSATAQVRHDRSTAARSRLQPGRYPESRHARTHHPHHLPPPIGKDKTISVPILPRTPSKHPSPTSPPPYPMPALLAPTQQPQPAPRAIHQRHTHPPTLIRHRHTIPPPAWCPEARHTFPAQIDPATPPRYPAALAPADLGPTYQHPATASASSTTTAPPTPTPTPTPTSAGLLRAYTAPVAKLVTALLTTLHRRLISPTLPQILITTLVLLVIYSLLRLAYMPLRGPLGL